jgi:hypothetical protein
MKKLFITLSVLTALTSFNANALEAIGVIYGVSSVSASVVGTLSTIYGPDCVVGQGPCKEAVQVIADAQDYMQSGKVSTFLGQKIKEIQTSDSSLSAEEALDVLTASAAVFLK